MKMSPRMHNDLRFFTLRVNESSEMAEKMAQDFENKFEPLDKYDKMIMAQAIDMDGWEKAFEMIESY